MSMKTLEKLRDMLCEELDEYAKKDDMSAGDLEAVHKLTDTVKNIDKICIMDEDGGYSQAGDWEATGRMSGNYGRNYDRGNSYANRGEHWVRGHYSRAARRDSRGRYSRDGGDLMEHIDMMMDESDDPKEKEIIRRFKKELERI